MFRLLHMDGTDKTSHPTTDAFVMSLQKQTTVPSKKVVNKLLDRFMA